MRIRSRLAAAAAFLLLGVSFANGAELFGKNSGSIYRIDTVTGAVTLIGVTPFGPNEIGIRFGDRAADGRLYCISNSFVQNQIYDVDDATGTTTVVYSLVSAPSTSLVGAAIDPTDGSMYYTNIVSPSQAELKRVDFVNGVEQTLGFIGTGAFYNGLTFDAAGNLFAIHKASATLWSVNKTTPSASTPIGSGLGGGLDLSTGADFHRDAVTGLVWGYEVKNKRLFTVDLVTGTATLHGVPLATHPTLVSIFGDALCGAIEPYGAGCAGAGGFVPVLGLTPDTGCMLDGGGLSLSIQQGLGNSTALLFFGVNQAALPIGAGCTLNVAPIVGAPIVLPIFGVGPGSGYITVNSALPAGLSGITFTMQAFVVDPASAVGGSATNGLKISIL